MHKHIRTTERRIRVMPPKGHVWPGCVTKQHVAYPAPGKRCDCGHC